MAGNSAAKLPALAEDVSTQPFLTILHCAGKRFYVAAESASLGAYSATK